MTTHAWPVFQCAPGSSLAASIGPAWALVPLRIPTGWAIRWNSITARARPSGQIEANDSEDLFWAVKLPPNAANGYETDPTSPWREIHVDAGWYRDRFRIVMLDPDWDHVRHRYETRDLEAFVRALEDWLQQIACDGDVRTPR